MQNENTRTWAAFWALGAIWGSSFLWIELGLEELQPFTLVALRLGIGLLGLWAILLATGRRVPTDSRTLLKLGFLGVFNPALPFVLITWGQTFIPSSMAGILNAAVPLFSMLIGHFLLADEHITGRRAFGLLLGFGGVLLIFSPDLLAAIEGANGGGLAVIFSGVQGQLAVLGAALCYAVTIVFVRRSLQHVEPLSMAAGSQVASVIIVTAAALLWESPFSSTGGFALSTQTWIAVGWLGLLGVSIAYILNWYIVSQWGATRTTLVTYVIPVVAFVLGVVVLGERITWQLMGGGLLILGGIALVNRPQRPAHPGAAS